MLFNSFEYLLFLPIVIALYWALPKQLKIVLLIAASYLFYMSAFKIYGLLLFGLTAVNYLLGLLMAAVPDAYKKRLVLLAGITCNLGMLALYKYTNFILDSINGFLGFGSSWLKLWEMKSTGIADLPIILPLGISFFVFEFIHYLTDIYRGHKPIKNPLRFALFASFFPSQIAGPIKRYQDFDKQLDKLPSFESTHFYSGLWLLARGLFKKVALGDNLAPVVRAGFDNPHLLGTGDAWLCVVAFAFQIYFDFSGYTDIGRGSAMMLGFSLPENFNMPYIASSLRDFWTRWHISLSTWLKDYLYIPLGGSIKGEVRTQSNLILTLLLGGLWHGAAWTYVVWGAFHGLGLAINRCWDNFLDRRPHLEFLHSMPAKLVAIVITFVTVLNADVIFRAKNLPDAVSFFQAMYSLRAPSIDCAVSHLFVESLLPVAFTLYSSAVLIALASRAFSREFSPSVAFWNGPGDLGALPARRSFHIEVPLHAMATVAACVVVFALTLSMCPSDAQPFIYFQF